jgi:hypothetical protein
MANRVAACDEKGGGPISTIVAVLNRCKYCSGNGGPILLTKLLAQNLNKRLIGLIVRIAFSHHPCH